MKMYYYEENGEQIGPFTLEELKDKRLKKSTLVWAEGLPDWVAAETREELSDFLISAPPPLPNKVIRKNSDPIICHLPEQEDDIKYDHFYRNDITSTIIGIIIFVINIIVLMLGKIIFKYQVQGQILPISIILRVIITIWCVGKAAELNREKTIWGIFAFFLPSIALIFIGLQKKFLYSKNYSSYSDINKSIENNNIAYQKSKSKLYTNALFFADKSIALNSENHFAFDTRGFIKFYLGDYSGALRDLNISIELNPNFPIKYYHRGYVYKAIENNSKAIDDWKRAAEMGYADAKIAIQKFEIN